MSTAFDKKRFHERLKTQFLGRTLICRESVGSTQDLAREEARKGAAEGTIVLAEEQTKGRGRLGRAWVSPPGENIYATLLLRPELGVLRYLSMIAPLAIAQAVEEETGLAVAIKWPNDIMISGRKLAGVLIESELREERVEYSLVGMGVNVNLAPQRFPEIEASATSLKEQTGKETTREEFLATLLNRFEGLYLAAKHGEPPYKAWRERLETLGKSVQVTW
ncbi:MAG TPA: biotin--[acetyl-CoA-carboxylase] ligase, partial [Dehalococcoidia bacterium]|nr:biotin--[acetyl-CoA-carboxylase] ligase [Dehalococcoidia bacterium]